MRLNVKMPLLYGERFGLLATRLTAYHPFVWRIFKLSLRGPQYFSSSVTVGHLFGRQDGAVEITDLLYEYVILYTLVIG